MLFDWDDEKDAEVQALRGFGFVDAVEIFLGHTVEWQDDRKDYGETRMIAVGTFGGIFYTVVFTDRGPVRRIVTAWHSALWERQPWRRSV